MKTIICLCIIGGVWAYVMHDDHATKDVERIIEQSRYEAEIKPYMDWGRQYVPDYVMGNLK